MASKSFTRHPTDEVHAAVMGSGEGGGEEDRGGKGGGGRGAVVLQMQLLGTAGGTPI